MSELPNGMGRRVRVSCSAREIQKRELLIQGTGMPGGLDAGWKALSKTRSASLTGHVQWEKYCCLLLLAYLGLQMEALRRRQAFLIWVAMGVLQLAALAAFPYATLMAAGITAVSAGWAIVADKQHRVWLTVLVYGVLCAVADSAFARFTRSGVVAASRDISSTRTAWL